MQVSRANKKIHWQRSRYDPSTEKWRYAHMHTDTHARTIGNTQLHRGTFVPFRWILPVFQFWPLEGSRGLYLCNVLPLSHTHTHTLKWNWKATKIAQSSAGAVAPSVWPITSSLHALATVNVYERPRHCLAVKFSLRVQTWCEVRGCGFITWLRSPFSNCGCGQGVSHGGLCRTKTGQFFFFFFCKLRLFLLGVLLLKGEAVGETRGRLLSCSECTRRNAPPQHFKCGWRQKAGLLLRYLILQQTQQKQKRLIYLNLAGNTSALAAVPACWGKSRSGPEPLQILKDDF